METASLNLKRMREQAELSKRELAELAGDHGVKIYANTISRLESGEQVMKLQEAIAFSEIFGVTLEAFSKAEELPNRRESETLQLLRHAQAEFARLQKSIDQAVASLNAVRSRLHSEQDNGATYPALTHLQDFSVNEGKFLDALVAAINDYRHEQG